MKKTGPPNTLYTTVTFVSKYMSETGSNINLRLLIGLAPKGKQMRWLVENEICFVS
jgi:hypothetical protein